MPNSMEWLSGAAMHNCLCIAFDSGAKEPTEWIDRLSTPIGRVDILFVHMPQRVSALRAFMEKIAPGTSVYLLLHQPPKCFDREGTPEAILTAYLEAADEISRQRALGLRIVRIGFATENPAYAWMFPLCERLLRNRSAVIDHSQLGKEVGVKCAAPRFKPWALWNLLLPFRGVWSYVSSLLF